MVKNTKGGSKHKKFARKNVKGNSTDFDERVRKSSNKDEIYASVAKILGNGRVEILCNDGQTRHCVIRNKFRGKNKRSNEVTTGSVILAGLRSWETYSEGKKETCDLLCVYNNSQINKLKTEPNINMGLLQSTSKTAFDKEDNIDFFDRGMPSSDDEDSNEETPDENNELIAIDDNYQENEDVLSLMNLNNEDIINVDDI